jgi:hypothetical protein
MNQKELMSNIMPNKDISEPEEKKAERKTDTTMNTPESRSQLRGIDILPSENLAMAQKIIEIANPATRSNPLEVSTGILVNGKQKTGKRTITKKRDKKEILSKIFDHIIFYKLLIH